MMQAVDANGNPIVVPVQNMQMQPQQFNQQQGNQMQNQFDKTNISGLQLLLQFYKILKIQTRHSMCSIFIKMLFLGSGQWWVTCTVTVARLSPWADKTPRATEIFKGTSSIHSY